LDYSALLLQIENQLQTVHKKGQNYMNIEAMPRVELRRVIEGLGAIIPVEKDISQKQQEKQTSFPNHPDQSGMIQYKNTHPKFFPPPADIAENQDKGNKVKQQSLTKAFAQIVIHQESAKKINTLSELFQKYEDCQRCALGKTRKNLVFGRGLSNATVMFLGEGPGADEDAQGEPFVGRAGRLLTKMISALGIERSDVYITNIVKCRPPENRNPTPAEISCCLPIIKQQIKILNPKLIVTLGNIPTKTLIPELPGITKARGKIQQYENWTVLPTFHPSYLLRNRSAMPLAWEDFKKIPELAFNN
jgi:DNA polymerase